MKENDKMKKERESLKERKKERKKERIIAEKKIHNK